MSILSYFLEVPGINESHLLKRRYLEEVKDVVIAFDRDRAGIEMTERIKEQLPQAIVKKPKAKDWNIDLVNSLDCTSQKRRNEIKRQRGIERDGGLSL